MSPKGVGHQRCSLNIPLDSGAHCLVLLWVEHNTPEIQPAGDGSRDISGASLWGCVPEQGGSVLGVAGNCVSDFTGLVPFLLRKQRIAMQIAWQLILSQTHF